MKFRLAMWAMVGFLVAAGWAFYATATFPQAISRANPLVWNLAVATQPLALASMHFNFPASMYWVFVTNAAAYAVLGLLVESLRRQLRPAK